MSRPIDTIVDQASRALRASGGRLTAPRRAVITVLAEADEHMSAEALCTRVQAIEPGVNRSSVYRILDALGRSGVVHHVQVSGAAAYHLSVAAVPHLHAQCQRCGRVLDLPDGILDHARVTLLHTHGFDLEPRRAALAGTCHTCAGREAPPSKGDRPGPATSP